MSDVAFIVLTIVVFAVLALAVRGVERLVGQPLESERSELSGGPNGTEYEAGCQRDYPSGATSRATAGVGAGGLGVHPDKQVPR